MGRRRGYAAGDIPATLPRRLAEEDEKRQPTVQGGNALSQWVADVLTRRPELPEAGPAGTFPANNATLRWLRHWLGENTEPWRPTCEEADLAEDRRSLVWVGKTRLNNGRGSMVWDAVVPDCYGRLTPVSLKGGHTASDVALGAALEVVERLVRNGAPLWVAVVTGTYSGTKIPYVTGEETNLPAPTGEVKVEWFNLTPHLSALNMSVETEKRDGKYPAIRIRMDWRDCKVADGIVGRKGYPRLNVRLGDLEPDYTEILTIEDGDRLTVPESGW